MKIVCLLADKFEDIEALGTVAILRRAGIVVDMAAAENVSVVTGAFGTKVIPDIPMENVRESDYDGVFIPGGSAVPTLREMGSVRRLIQAFAKAKKMMCAICAGPSVLGALGLLDGVRYTCFPGAEKFMPAGIRIFAPSVIDGKIVTAAGAGCVMEFAYDIITVALGKAKSEEIQKRMQYHVF
jgi:DJ-1 family protein